MDDGRLLTLATLGAIGLAGIVRDRGSRGVVRRGQPIDRVVLLPVSGDEHRNINLCALLLDKVHLIELKAARKAFRAAQTSFRAKTPMDEPLKLVFYSRRAHWYSEMPKKWEGPLAGVLDPDDLEALSEGHLEDELTIPDGVISFYGSSKEVQTSLDLLSVYTDGVTWSATEKHTERQVETPMLNWNTLFGERG